MKNLILSMLLALTLSSCLSSELRQTALLPAVQLMWVGVRADVDHGIEDAVNDGELLDRTTLDLLVLDMDIAIEAGERNALKLIPWAILEPYAKRGIQARIDEGQVSKSVAGSLRERLRSFTAGFATLLAKYIWHGPAKEREYWAGGGRVTDEVAIAILETH